MEFKKENQDKQTPVYQYLPIYVLEMNLNNHKVAMKIDSGCHESIVNKTVWQQLGKPQLEPILNRRLSATGAQVHLKGQFIATVKYGGRCYQLLLQVSDRPDTRNLLGRRWFPYLHLDWNSIFHCNLPAGICRFQLPSAKQDKLISAMTSRSNHFIIQLKMNGLDVRMMLDTGATRTKINLNHWQLLGKPTLKPSEITIIDTANKVIPLEGECSVEVEYQGQKAIVPILVMNGTFGCAIIGTSWFKYLRFDFNSIFESITFADSAPIAV